jgi:ectoine hydroxylase
MSIRRSGYAMPFRFDWHQDGGRQNREIETTPRSRLSVKLAYWLSDVSEPGSGNLRSFRAATW